ncbi:ATP-binding SpoIIE family protein phosphatase [Streptomyces sp. NPDC001941]|uniref:ATP-binding SpoIIE family protein phosphatase n=1 Tax=Streptomyces sp. NPDC001941 TaxID=3154659 RepID=UPI00331DE6BF
MPEPTRSRTVGSIPSQRDTAHQPALPHDFPEHRADARARPAARTSLPGNPLAPAEGRRFVRTALAGWTALGPDAAGALTDRVADDAVLVVNELVTNAVVHAGTTVELLVRFEEPADDHPGALVLEVSDHHPSRPVRGEPAARAERRTGGTDEYGRGLQLVASLAECWGITYRPGLKTVWARLPLAGWDALPHPAVPDPAPRDAVVPAVAAPPAPAHRRGVRDDADWVSRGALSFLAEASDLLAGQLDEDLVAALAGQLLVPRLADWCAVWLEGEAAGAPRLARVWHADESAIERLRLALGKEPPPAVPHPGPVPVPWPCDQERDGRAVAYRLVAGGRALGTLLVGRECLSRTPDEVSALIEDFARRVALAIGAARQYARQATISRVLQRGLLPSQVARIPGVDTALVYEPSGDGVAGGDFYDIFPAGRGRGGDRWCFVLGDVQGSGPEAAVVTGLARPWLRLLAREGYEVGEVLDRLNRLLLDDAMEAAEAAEAAAHMVVAAGGRGGTVPDLPQPRFLSLLYGELEPLPAQQGGGARCTLASAGHPLPLLLRPDGSVRPAASSQVLLGVVDDVAYESRSFVLAPGETLLCVTDGVTERRSGTVMFDDGDGLQQALARCARMTAQGVADRIRRAVHDFSEEPPGDDLALLVLQAG